ncbi:MAG: site-specific integrase [Myxococcales bacterium]|nr:site-specific integrase [Myxococcales bacterium]
MATEKAPQRRGVPGSRGAAADAARPWKVQRRCGNQAGLPPISFHGLRHSYASQLVMAGVPLQAVQEYLGHPDIRQTQRYAHLSPRARATYVEVSNESPLPVPGRATR